MKLTNEEMSRALEVLNTVTEHGRLGYAIARNKRKISTEVQEYLQFRDEALRKYGLTDDGIRYRVPAGKIKEYSDALAEIGQAESEIDVYQVDEETFINSSLSNKDMDALFFMLKDGDNDGASESAGV